MSDTSLKPKIAVVTGGSRGLGRGIVEALVGRGMRVIAVARDAAGLEGLARALPGSEPVVADAADEKVAGRLLRERQPELVVLCAGASPALRPLHHHSWETFSENWHVDTKSA